MRIEKKQTGALKKNFMSCSKFVKGNAFAGEVFILEVGEEGGSVLLRQDKEVQISEVSLKKAEMQLEGKAYKRKDVTLRSRRLTNHSGLL